MVVENNGAKIAKEDDSDVVYGAAVADDIILTEAVHSFGIICRVDVRGRRTGPATGGRSPAGDVYSNVRLAVPRLS